MSTANSGLPGYVASAQPVPSSSRIAWYKSTAQTYAGIMLWFVFWQDIPIWQSLNPETAGAYSRFAGGTLSQGLGWAFLGLVLAALACHFFYYLVPGLMGLKTGLPLYIVGTSTYGVTGGFLLPGFLMGLLQFGWLGVNAFFSSLLLVLPFGFKALSTPHIVVAAIWAIAAAFLGLKGIKYVAAVASFLPLIPLAVLVILFVATVGGLGSFNAPAVVQATAQVPVEGKMALGATDPLTKWGVVSAMLIYIIGFFATAGAAGADFGMGNRDRRDVQLGGLFGIALSTIFAGGMALLIVAGAWGMGKVTAAEPAMQTTALMDNILGPQVASVFMYLLAIAAFPPACFSAFIAANSFRTTLPKVNPFISVGIGTLFSIILAASGKAGNAAGVFTVIGASFGPICGAMVADYLLAGNKWPGPRAGFNPAGWLSWLVGFVAGAFSMLAGSIPALEPWKDVVPVPPLSAFVVGFLLYWLLARIGLTTRVLPMPQVEQQAA
jgi:cytosine permease